MADPRLLLNNSGREVPSVQRPVDDKLVRGTISEVSGSNVFALVPEYSQTYQFGPLEVVYSRGSTVPAVGDACLVVFDSQNVGYLLWFDAVAHFDGEPSVSSWGFCLSDGTIEESSGDFTIVKTFTARYEVKWKTAKATGNYAAVITPGASGAGKPLIVNFISKGTTGFKFSLMNLKEEEEADNFNFLVKNN